MRWLWSSVSFSEQIEGNRSYLLRIKVYNEYEFDRPPIDVVWELSLD
jgi:hypothetical protein